MPDVRIGISGWTYAPWRGTFYPPDLSQKHELAFASRQLNSIEINGSFYRMQRPAAYRAWAEQTPSDFVFALKAGRFVTHLRRLKDVELPLANFFASGILRLGRKLGPILWQLPPTMQYDRDRLEAFLALLPRTHAQAADLAKRREAWMRGREWLEPEHDGAIRHAIEVRHASFKDAAFIDQLRTHDAAVVVADTAGKWPVIEDVTSDFVYCRLHGDEELYVSGYTDAALDAWAKKLTAWRRGAEPAGAARVRPKPAEKRPSRDAYVYFDNDVKVRSPFDAMNLARRLGLPGPAVEPGPAPTGVTEQPRAGWSPMRYGRGPKKKDPTKPKKAVAVKKKVAKRTTRSRRGSA